MKRITFLLLCIVSLFGADYDCIVIGTSPLLLFESLYHHALGKKVLILEEGCCCGGAWQSVNICGVLHADLGCHEIGSNKELKEFLETYGGCSFIELESGHNFYFSKGCYELVHNLEQRIANSSIELLKHHRVDRVVIDEANKKAIVESGQEKFTASKVYAPSYSYFPIGDEILKELKKTKYYHLYLLIQDATPPKFSYRAGIAHAARMVNLTPFVDLKDTGQQLIIFQTWSQEKSGQMFLDELKMQNLVDPSAYILKEEWCIYEQYPSTSYTIKSPYFEQLQTFDFRGISQHITRWKEALAIYDDAVRKN